MVKVIKQPIMSWAKEVDCVLCRAALEVELSDLKYVAGQGDGPMYSSPKYTFECPCCHHENSIEYKEIPAHLGKKVQEGTHKRPSR